MNRLILRIVLALLAIQSHAAIAGDSKAWQALAAGGHVALMRHAIAPGTGDPSGFSIDDCASQRNLSAEGREQARKIGQAFRERRVPVAGVYSSQWCRCLETARLLDLGDVTPLPALNSFFRRNERRDRQTNEIRAWLKQSPSQGALVLVTHQVNITALTGIFPQSGETIVVRAGKGEDVRVIGRIPAP